MDGKNSSLEQIGTLAQRLAAALEKTNNVIAEKGCLEIEIADLRWELRIAYREISELKSLTTK